MADDSPHPRDPNDDIVGTVYGVLAGDTRGPATADIRIVDNNTLVLTRSGDPLKVPLTGVRNVTLVTINPHVPEGKKKRELVLYAIACGESRVWVTGPAGRTGIAIRLQVRCLLGDDDHPGASGSRFELVAQLRQRNGSLHLIGLRAGDGHAADYPLIGDLTNADELDDDDGLLRGIGATIGTIRAGAGLGPVLRRLDFAPKGLWRSEPIQIHVKHVEPPPSEDPKPRTGGAIRRWTISLERRLERVGDETRIRPFMLPAPRGQYMAVVQEPLELVEPKEPGEPANPPNADAPRPAQQWRLSLRYSHPYPKNAPPQDPLRRFDRALVLRAWNENVALPHLSALRLVQPTDALSVLPVFDVEDPEFPADFDSDPEWVQTVVALIPRPADQARDVDLDDLALRRFRLGLRPPAAPRPGPSPTPLPGHFPNIRTHDGQPLRCQITVSRREFTRFPPADVSDAALDEAPGEFAFGFNVQLSDGAAPTSDSTLVRLGALDLTMSRLLAESRTEQFRSSARTWFGRRGDLAEVDVTVKLPVTEITPAAQDADEPGGVAADRSRPPAIVLPLHPSPTVGREEPDGPPYAFSATETKKQTENRRLIVELHDVVRRSAPRGQTWRALIVDASPMLVAEVEFEPFAGVPLRADEAVTRIGDWHSGTGEIPHWQVRGEDPFRLRLPPQTTAERTLGSDAHLNPLPDPKALPYWFGPPALLHLDRHPLRPTRFAEPAWNLRRLFGSFREALPGMGLERIRTELLYGMQLDVDRPRLLLSEMAARLGRVPEPLRPLDPERGGRVPAAVYDEALDHWSHVRRQYGTRLALLEPYRPGEEGSPVITQNLRFTLRDLDPPLSEIGDGMNPAGKTRWAGGVLAIVEPPAQRLSLMSERQSIGGMVTDLAFSAHGGWGYQRAEFGGGTTVHSYTSQGRVHYQAVEQIGRLSGFYNYMKHVVVYERRVAPTRQFYGGRQDAAPWRPILRKVREFCQAIQPHRVYPDGTFSQASPGPLRGCRVQTEPINVNSARRLDFADETLAYAIPLWHPDDEAALPDVYPKPRVEALLASLAEAEADAPHQLKDPSNLVFYAAFPAGGRGKAANPDEWPPRHGVDYGDDPDPEPPDGVATDPVNAEADLGESPASEPGLQRFTHELVPIPQATRVLAGREGGSAGAAAADEDGRGESVDVSAFVHNITLMRATPVAVAGVAADVALLRRRISAVETSVRDAAAAFDEAVAIATGDAADVARVKGLVKSRLDRLADAAGKVPFAAAINGIGNPVDLVGKLCDLLKQRLREEVTTAFNKVLIEKVDRGLADAEEHAATATENVGRIPASAADDVHGWFEQARRLAAELTAPLDAVAALQVRLADLRARALELQNAPAAPELGKVRAVIAEARQAVAEASRRLAQVRVAPLREALAAALEAVRGGADDLERVLAAGEAKIREALGEVAGHLEQAGKAVKKLEGLAAKLDAVQRLTDVEKELAQDLANKLWDGLPGGAPAVKDFEELGVKLRSWTGTFPRAAFQVFRLTVGTRLAALRDDVVAGVDAAVTELCKEVEKALPTAAKLNEWAEARLGNLATKAQELRDRVEQQFDGTADKLRAWANEVRGDVLDRVRPVADQYQQALGFIREKQRQLQPLAAEVFQKADGALRLQRALVDLRNAAKGADVNRKLVAAYFRGENVDLAPVTAYVDRVADKATRLRDQVEQVTGMRLRVPTQRLGRVFEPVKDAVQEQFSKIMPSLGGLELNNLFKALKLPEAARDAIKVTHGFDKRTLTAWVKAETRFKLPRPHALFSLGPIALQLANAGVEAFSEVRVAANGNVTRESRGEVRADWEVRVGGQPLVTFSDSRLTYVHGKLSFDLSPRKVKLHSVLKFISDAVERLGLADEGFSVALRERDGLPVGVKALLNLPLPDVMSGTTGFTGIVLRGALELELFDVDTGKFDFSVGLLVGLSQRYAPFNISFFILGGCGFLELYARYWPGSGALTVNFSLALGASASLGLTLGPISGFVSIQLLITADFIANSADSSHRLRLGALLVICGGVSVLGIISIEIRVTLELIYERSSSGNNGLLARGRIQLKIKICWCFTLKVSAKVEYKVGTVTGGDDNVRLGVPPPALALGAAGLAAAGAAGAGAAAAAAAGAGADGDHEEQVRGALTEYFKLLV